MNVHVPGGGNKIQGQYQTDCKDAQKAALACATEHPGERARCDALFQAYKACRRAEHQRILDARGRGE